MGKVFVNKGLRLSKSAENGFGAASRAVLGNGTTLHCLNQITIIEQGGLRVGDDAHSLGVMKKVKGPRVRMGMATSNYGGEISRTATGDGPLPRIGVPAALVPQPAMLMTVVIRVPAYGGGIGGSGAFCPSGFIKSCTKPMIATGLTAPPLLSNTGTVTSESLTITSCGDRPVIGLSLPARNSKGEFGGP